MGSLVVCSFQQVPAVLSGSMWLCICRVNMPVVEHSMNIIVSLTMGMLKVLYAGLYTNIICFYVVIVFILLFMICS